MTDVTIHAGAACPQQDGPGGFAAILSLGDRQITLCGGNPSTTAHRMRLTAVIHALRLLPHHEVPEGTLVTLAEAPGDIGNLLQTRVGGPKPQDADLHTQLLEASRAYPLLLLGNSRRDGADLTAHCAAIAAEQLEPTILYQVAWHTASMALAPLEDNAALPGRSHAVGGRTETQALRMLEDLLQLIADAEDLATLQKQAAMLVAKSSKNRKPDGMQGK